MYGTWISDSPQRRGEREVNINELTEKVLGAAIEVHRWLGPGLLESSYEACLGRELELRGIRFERQVDLPIDYKGLAVKGGYRVDLLIEQVLIVEIKAVEEILPVHQAQLLTYLRLAGKPVGLLLNFNVPVLRQGIRRLVNNYLEDSAPSAPQR
jgi:GxxExxY protein